MMKKLLLMMAVLTVPMMGAFAQEESTVETGLTISGEVTAKGYVGPFDGQDQSGSSLAGADTHLRFTYNFSEYSGAQISVGFGGDLNENPTVNIKDAWGWSDILGELGVNDIVGLKISMGMLRDDGGIRNRYFNASKGLDFGFETGDGVYADTGSATDTYNWRLDIPMNFMSDVFPLNLGVTSDLDFSRKNSGHSVIVELSSQGMEIADGMVNLNWNVYYHNFVNSHNNVANTIENGATNRTNNYDFMSVGGSLGADIAIGDSMLLGVGTAMMWQQQRNAYSNGLPLVDTKRNVFNMMAGVHFGMVDIFDLHFAFMGFQGSNADGEDKAFSKNWLALRANFLMIPKVMIYGGLGIGLTDNITNKISYDVGVRFDPIDNLFFMVGWQAGSTELGSIEAVESTVQGAIYVRATWSF